MSNYGVTKNGFVRKRYDVIYQEMQSDIKADTGIDISVNPQSYINVLVASVADKLAALHEIAETVYYAHYPSTADGDNLDYAVQLGGISREEAAATKYYILCTGDDGTVISADYRIATSSTPVTYFKPNAASQITRSSFNKATISFVDNDTANTAGIDYEIYIDNATFYYESVDDIDDDYSGSDNGVALTVLKALKEQVSDAGYTAKIDEDNLYLIIEVQNEYDNSVLDLNENLTTVSVSSVILFKSEKLTKLKIAEGVITQIISGTSGWKSCTNLAVPIYGRERETDAELRMSYIEKQAYRSSSMISSITAAIIANVDDVVSAYGFENDTNDTENGRPPHSIEIVVDGGTDALIAQQILYYKAAGIQTCSTTGNEVSVDVPTEYNHTVNIVFSRPTTLYVWLFVNIVKNPNEAMPSNYEDLIKDTIIEYTDDIVGGENIVLQKMIASIMSAVSGIAYLTINAYYSEDSTEPTVPTYSESAKAWTYTDYEYNYIAVTESQKASFSSDRITIGIQG